MKCVEVMEKFNELVPFPVTPAKIKDAGYDVTTYLSDLANELAACDDLSKNRRAMMVCDMVNEVEQLRQAGR